HPLPPVSAPLFASSRPLPALPSFPTRRSSDLRYHHCGTLHPAAHQLPHHRGNPRLEPGPAARGTDRRHGRRRRIDHGLPLGTARSEEHTSELQSRENLVCRLLLEKKKNKQTAI